MRLVRDEVAWRTGLLHLETKSAIQERGHDGAQLGRRQRLAQTSAHAQSKRHERQFHIFGGIVPAIRSKHHVDVLIAILDRCHLVMETK